ncbi:PQQ-dependent dehydrogenase, methanol/ethanol family, partial [Acinetobacter baumannii]
KGETLTASPLVVKDKVYVGISGGEFGVRGHLTAYDINSGKMVWRAYSTGSDKDVMIDPQKTLMMGKPIGEPDLGIKTWPADQWKIGGGTTW